MSVTDQIWLSLTIGAVIIFFEGVATWVAYILNGWRYKEKRKEYLEKASESAVKIPVGSFLYFLFQVRWLWVDQVRFVEILVVALVGIAITVYSAIVTFRPVKK